MRQTNFTIEPGMGATMYVGSDRYAMVVTEVLTPKKIKVAHMTDNDEQNNLIEDENGIQRLSELLMEKYADGSDKLNSYYKGTVYTLRKNGRWMPAGAGMNETCGVRIGRAETWLDPSF